jgi:hypothetical protein
VKRDKWVWMPHAGHLIVSNQCRFHLNTYVGKYIVSTVGEYVPDAPVREIEMQCRGKTLVGKGDARLADWFKKNNGFEEIGCGRKYETMVFKAKKSNNSCCPWEASDFSEIDMEGYNTPEEAYVGHLKMCKKYSKKKFFHDTARTRCDVRLGGIFDTARG